jgi:hypothetical protein
MPTSNYLGNQLLDAVLGDTPYNAPNTLYLALYTASPTPSTSGTEVTGGSYARVAITNDATNFPNAASKTKSNALSITFAAATASWGTVVAVALCDASTAGNILIYALLSAPRLVNNGDTPSFAIGQLVFNAT